MEGADNHSTQRAGPPEPQARGPQSQDQGCSAQRAALRTPHATAREPLSHVRRHGRHNLLQTGRFRHNLLGGRRSHPQTDLQPLPRSERRFVASRTAVSSSSLTSRTIRRHKTETDKMTRPKPPEMLDIPSEKCTTPPSLSGPRVPRAVSADDPRSPPPVGLLLAHLLLHEGFSLGLVVGRPSVIMDTDRCFPCQLATVRCNPSSSENSGR